MGNPGWFRPGQASKAAKFLGVSLRTFFFRHLIIEYWTGGPDIFVLAPRRTNQSVYLGAPSSWRAGWSDNFSKGKCSLLGKKGCILPLDLRPAECAAHYGCEKSCSDDRGIRTNIKDEWLKECDEFDEIDPSYKPDDMQDSS